MAEWSTLPLGEVVTFQRGYDLPTRDRKRGPVPIVSSAGVTDFHNVAMVQPPGVVTGRYGTIGEIFFVAEPFWALNTTLYVRDFHGNDPRFIYYLLQRFDFQSFSGKSGVPGVNRNDLHVEPITLPTSITEQRAIAEALSDVDALLAALDRLIAKKRDLKQATMQQLLTGQTRLPGDWNVESGYKQTKEAVIPKDWNIFSLNDITTEIGDGLHGTPIYSSSGTYFFVNGNNLRDGRLVITDETKTLDYSEFIKNRKNLNDRSILISINGTIGNLGLFKGEAVVLGKSAAYLNIKNGFSKLYVYYALQTKVVRYQFVDGLTGSTISNLGLTTIRNTMIPLPPTEAEQTAIADVLSDMDAELAAIEQRRAKIRLLKQAMMQELLTGRTRLVEKTAPPQPSPKGREQL